MSKEKKLALSNAEGLIPELRFPEFVNEGEWKIDLLGQLADIKGRIGYRGYTTADIVKKGEGAITLSPSNFDENCNLNFERCTYITWDKYEESPEIQLEVGQTVLVKTASVGKSAYVNNLPEKATVNPQIVVLKPKKIQNRFLAYTISHNNIQHQIKNCVGAGAIPNLSQESISKFKVIFPPDKEKAEQQKIASCLSSLDEVIAAQSQKLDLLKEHKKGLMQNLFPQEGEKVPKLRFKEFMKDGKWNYLNGDKLFKSIANKNHKSDLPILAITQEQGAIPRKMIDYHVSVTDKSIESYKVVEVGDFIISLRSFQGGIEYSNYLGLCSPAYIILRKKLDIITDFYRHYFKSIPFIRELNRNLEGIRDGKMVSYKQFSEILIPKPSKAEQQKIASCLTSLDVLIKYQTEKVEQLKLHKKGLMQGLFPKINE